MAVAVGGQPMPVTKGAAGGDRGERGQDPGEQGDAGLPQVRGGGALRARPPARRDQGAGLPQLRRADWIIGAGRPKWKSEIGTNGVAVVATRLKERYQRDVVPRLRTRFAYRNVMQVPRVEKAVVNMRVGDAVADPRQVVKAVGELTLITVQRPLVTRAKKSIANFKLRAGVAIGAKVTLRGDRMYDFLDKLFSVALPRIKDFKGISERAFDGRGNLNIGMKEQLIFPEIDYDKVEKIRGMDITIVTTARTDEEARELLRLLGLPLREAGPGPRDRAGGGGQGGDVGPAGRGPG